MVQLKGQVLGHDVTVVDAVPLEAAAALEQDHDELLARGGQRDRIDVGAKAAEQLAVHRHHPKPCRYSALLTRADTP